MSIAFVKNGGTLATTTSAATQTITVPAGGHALGSLVLVACTASSGVPTSVTDARGNTYTGIAAGGVNGMYASVLTTALQAGDLITMHWGTTSGAGAAASSAEFSGATITTDVAGAIATAASTTPSSGAITPPDAVTLCLGLCDVTGAIGDTFTQDSTHTGGGDSWHTLARAGTATAVETLNWAYKITTSSAAQTYAPTLGTSRTWVAAVYSLKPSPAVAIAPAAAGASAATCAISAPTLLTPVASGASAATATATAASGAQAVNPSAAGASAATCNLTAPSNLTPVASSASSATALASNSNVPYFVASASGATASGGAASVGVAIPAGAWPGDFAIFVATIGAPTTGFTTPAGLTKFEGGWSDADLPTAPQGWPPPATPPAGNVAIHLWTRRIQAGDAGTTITFTPATGTQVMTASCAVYRNVAGIGVGPIPSTNGGTPAQDGGTTPSVAEIFQASTDLVVVVGAIHASTSTGTNLPLSAAPAGWSIRENVQANPTSGQNSGTWIADANGATSALQTLTFTNTVADYNVTAALALTPIGKPLTDAVPSALQGKPLRAYGESLFAWVAPSTNPPYKWFASAITADRIAHAIQPSDYENYALSGSFAADVCCFAYGSSAFNTRMLTGGPSPLPWSRAGTWMALSDKTGLVIVDLLGNDAIHDQDASPSTPTKSRAGATNFLDALVRLLRASSMVGPTDASIAYTGSWSSASVALAGNGAYKYTTTPGDKVTITVTQDSIDAVLLAVDDALASFPGASFSVKVDGSAFTTGTTSNQLAYKSSSYANTTAAQQCIPVHGMGAGSHTIEITHTGTSGQVLCFNAYLIPSATPPLIQLNKLEHFDATALAAANTSNAIMDVYSGIVATVASRFTDGLVKVYDPLASGLWDYPTMVNTQDNVHPLNKGTGFLAHEQIANLSAATVVVAPSAGSASAATVTLTAPTALGPQASGATQATATVTAAGLFSPAAASSSSATCALTAAGKLAPQAAGQSQATSAVTAATGFAPQAAAASQVTVPLTAATGLAVSASAAAQATASSAAPGLLVPAAGSVSTATCLVTAPAVLSPAAASQAAASAFATARALLATQAVSASQATVTLTAAASLAPTAAAVSQATAPMPAFFAPAAGSAGVAGVAVSAAASVSPAVSATAAATAAATSAGQLVPAAAGASSATAAITAGATLDPVAQSAAATAAAVTAAASLAAAASSTSSAGAAISAGALEVPIAHAVSAASALATAGTGVAPAAAGCSTATVVLSAASALVPSASCAAAASAADTAASSLGPSAGATSAATVPVASGGAVLSPASTTQSAAQSAVTAATALGPAAQGVTTASAPVTAGALLTPTVGAASGASATVTVASVPTLTVTAQSASSSTAATASSSVVAATSQAASSTSSSLTAAARLAAAAGSSSSAGASIAATVSLVLQAGASSAAAAAGSASSGLSVQAGASSTATGSATTAQPVPSPSAAAASAAACSITTGVQLTPTAAVSSQATSSSTGPGRLTPAAAASSTAITAISEAMFLALAANGTSAASARVSAGVPLMVTAGARSTATAAMVIVVLIEPRKVGTGLSAKSLTPRRTVSRIRPATSVRPHR